MLYKPFVVTLATAVITITGLVPSTDIAFPQGATHLFISRAMVAGYLTVAGTVITAVAQATMESE